MMAHAQSPCDEPHLPFDPVFSCVPRSIDAASGGSIIAACDDEIRVCLGKPLPEKHPGSPVGSPVRLFRLDQTSATDDVVAERAFHWYPDTATGSVVIIPDPPLEVSLEDPRLPVLFRLVVDCQYWHGPGDAAIDTAFVDLWKQHVVRLQGAAHRLHDGADISSAVVVTPSPVVSTRFVSSGVALDAEESERYRFDHWSASVELPGFDPRVPSQILHDICWPLEDTVQFTAWYRDVTSTVEPPLDASVVVRLTNGRLQIVSDRSPITGFSISDIHGRVHLWRENLAGSTEVNESVGLPPGLFLVAVHSRAGVSTFPCFNIP